ncbi:SDR family NAD(P)-dependent oxidoreductase [Acuticoccus yangtzensis]|uniref:SDR family NAD(P)-dependent oxidoreductase n=1 Tax=Acuticoccus yangtzensis TaxID=1443441 RepID=UPI0009496505|nr:SDR family NAD(P)-dependent oxidoreductase [Acuticoccus yangtzensis]
MIGNGALHVAPGKLPRTALVTGGAGALGFAVARRLAADGNRVAIVDLLNETPERATELPGGLGLSCDVSDTSAMVDAYRAVRDDFGPLGIVVHCAGIAPLAPFLDVDIATFEKALDVHVLSGFTVYQLAARDLVNEGLSGRFVMIASISGMRAGFGRTAYGTSKAAAIHLMKQLALELGPYGITANTVAPGPVDTPMSRDLHTAEMRADYTRTIPMARYGEEDETANAVAFFTSPDAGYVSGQTLTVDGGYLAAGTGVPIAQSSAAVRRAPPRAS